MTRERLRAGRRGGAAVSKTTSVPIDSLEESLVEERGDALLATAEEGYPLTMSYPFYAVAVIESGDSLPVM